MILIISEKQLKKSIKKLCKYHDFRICDGTDDDSASLDKYQPYVAMDGFNPPNRLVSGMLAKDDFDREISENKLEKLLDKYLKGDTLKLSMMAAVKAALSPVKAGGEPAHAFVVLRNKPYKAVAKKIKKRINKLFDIDFDFVYTYTELEGQEKDVLRKSLKDKDKSKLEERLAELEKDVVDEKKDK